MTDASPRPATESGPKGKITAIVITAVVLFLAVSIAIAAARGSQPLPSKPIAEKPAGGSSVEATAGGAITTGAPVPGKPGSAPSVQGGKARPRPVPATTGRPESVAKDGSKLTTLTAPPEKTIGMIVVPKGFKEGSYEISFQPYGWGPAGPSGGRLVASISESKPLDDGAKKLDRDFAKRNATLWCAPEIAKTISLGGSYKGTMQVRPQGDVGVLYLVKAEKAK